MDLVGREQELALLRAQVRAVKDGQFRCVLVGGDPGIGKTRLLAELDDGIRYVRGVCVPSPDAPPLWPWRYVLTVLGRPVPEGTGFDVLVRYAEELLAAAEEPLLVVVDDLQHADPATASLFGHLAALCPARPLGVIGAYRGETSPVSATGPAVARIRLRGLDAAGVGTYLEKLLDRPVPGPVVAELRRRTEGNPHLLAEIVPHLTADDLDGRGDRLPIRWPAEARAEAAARIDALDPATRAVLATASVIGREFDLAILERVATTRARATHARPTPPATPPGPGSAPGPDSGSDAGPGSGHGEGPGEGHREGPGPVPGTIRRPGGTGTGAIWANPGPTPGDPGHPPDLLTGLDVGVAAGLLTALPGQVYAFDRAVTREVLYESLPARDRARTHEATADALTAFSADVGERGPTAAELAHHLVAAAVLGGDDRLDRAISYSVAAGTAEDVGPHEAAGHFAAAVRLAVRADWPPAALGRLVVALGRARLAVGDLADGRGVLAAAARHARRAGDAELLAQIALSHGPRAGLGDTAPPPDQALVALLREALQGDVADPAPLRARLAVELVGTPEAASLAETAGDGPEALLALYAVDPRPGYAAAALRAATDPLTECRARLAVAHHQLELGAVAPARRELDEVTRLRLRNPLGRWWAAQAEAHVAILSGDLERAEPLVESALAIGRGADAHSAALGHLAQLTTLRALQGRLPDLAPALADLDHPAPRPPWLAAAAALVAAHRGESAIAEALLEAALGDERGSLWTSVLLLEVAALVGHTAAAERLTSALSPHAHRWIVIGPAVSSAGPVALVLARAGADPRRTAGWLELAGTMVAGTPWEVPEARTPGLTRREQEVLELAVGGASAKDIAERLFIGERTVETHLANIYRKLGVRSRIELVALHKT
ncbi:LuxR C-terminal-related transcriptional regulator [Longispora sp. K20-0274]|uniref:helix-turn-helix transcriptional regulator n=1 Tax=Longispora sp. K20-0274 TaxID=3088255 RepID=UPI00399C1F19